MKPKISILHALILCIVDVCFWGCSQPASIAVQLRPSQSPNSSPQLSASASDPQVELKTTLHDIARLLRSGDPAKVIQTYIRQDQFDPEVLQGLQQMQIAMAHDPSFLKQMETTAADYDTLAEQTPTYNATGDEASYTQKALLPTNTIPRPVIFVRIDGKWYQKSSIMTAPARPTAFPPPS